MKNTLDEGPLATLPENRRAALREYVELARQLNGDNLLGLTLFGEVLGVDFERLATPISSVFVLQEIDLAPLHRLAEHGPALGRKRIAAPLIMSPHYITESLDTFPLELLEIQQRCTTIFGQDCFAELVFAPEHMRLQCEREFKRMVIQLRQALLAATGREKILGEAVLGVGEHLLRTLRGMLWIQGRREWCVPNEVLAAMEQTAKRSLPGIRAALHPHGQRGRTDFESLYKDIETLADVADHL